MIFVSYAELAQDVITWSETLPRDIDVVAGVARSGMVPASILALHRNIRLTTVEDLRDGRIFKGGLRDQHLRIKKVLVLDDSLLAGTSLRGAKAMLRDVKGMEIHYGAVYMKPESRSPEWWHYKCIPMPRIFEWNWLHHFWLQKSCMDIDGVLCRDPTREENDDGVRYSKFLSSVQPRHLPTVQVHALVTNRLERYRTPTREWLRKHGVLYNKLIMHPAKTAKERRAMGDHAAHKARVYRHKNYELFIESSFIQSEEIHRLTQKPVLCTDTMKLYA